MWGGSPEPQPDPQVGFGRVSRIFAALHQPTSRPRIARYFRIRVFGRAEERTDNSCGILDVSGRGAAWLARLLGVQEVPGSNPGGPTSQIKDSQILR